MRLLFALIVFISQKHNRTLINAVVVPYRHSGTLKNPVFTGNEH